MHTLYIGQQIVHGGKYKFALSYNHHTNNLQPDPGIQCRLFFNKQCFFQPAQDYSMTDGQMTFPGVLNIETYYKTLNNPLGYICRKCPKGATWSVDRLFISSILLTLATL